MRFWLAIGLLGTVSMLGAQTPAAPKEDPLPATLDEFRATALRILDETKVPGASVALVRSDRVEWVGGLGFADRDKRTPVTEDTHFRVGSISKTFVAIGLVQMAEDGELDLDAPLSEVAPEVPIDNPWQDTDPVRVIHLLQHTAGFDDMHFNERYNIAHPPDMSLVDVLKINPRSRRVRWRPGTRMSYSNPGYGVAGYVLEKLAGQPYEDYINREIFQPLGMVTSSFRLTPGDEPLMAQGYSGHEGPPVGFPQIYLRPAGNMHSSAREMARFVQMLLNWGELGEASIVDPEYLGSMEQPRTTLASTHGLRTGYGSAIVARLSLPYQMMGHDGGIDGFASSYAYSPSRDVGYVILLNSTGSGASDAMRRLTTLATRFLKRDVQLPVKPEATLSEDVLRQYVGYYHDANPRNQIAWFLQYPLSGHSIELEDGQLYSRSLRGEKTRLIPVNETMVRLEQEVAASRVFATDGDGRMVLAGATLYAERTPRWRVDLLRALLGAATILAGSPLLVAIVWVARIRVARPRFFWELKLATVAATCSMAAPFIALALMPARNWGERNLGTMIVFLATLAIPTLAIVIGVFAFGARREGASRLLVGYTFMVAAAVGGLAAYLASHDLIGIRMWAD